MIKVSELIEKLKEMPQDAVIFAAYDSAVRLEPEEVYADREGRVVLAERNERLYGNDRPLWAPTDKECHYWSFKIHPTWKEHQKAYEQMIAEKQAIDRIIHLYTGKYPYVYDEEVSLSPVLPKDCKEKAPCGS